MKKLNTISLCFAAVTACVLGGTLPPVVAQTALPQKQQLRVIQVHNVRPDMMAYWIDPTHQPVPPEYQFYLTYSKLSQNQINQYIPQIKAFEHSFKGQIISIDAQNALMILTTTKH